ncbi:MAG: hypothetical protein EA402_09000 [Planctomycetota bacterium]|nr:MAG: hypothetical protein EA402_09000 [Planctomycetota bacterium]
MERWAEVRERSDFMIELRENPVIALGSKRCVYQHPFDEDSIIKVWRGDRENSNGKCLRYRQRQDLYREWREMVRVTTGKDPAFPYLVRFKGYELTDLGIGMVFQKVSSPDGDGLGWTLDYMKRNQIIDCELEFRLLELLRAVLRSSIVVADIGPFNILYGKTKSYGLGFRIVDGIGDKTLVPIMRFSSFIRKRRKIVAVSRLLHTLGISEDNIFKD